MRRDASKTTCLWLKNLITDIHGIVVDVGVAEERAKAENEFVGSGGTGELHRHLERPRLGYAHAARPRATVLVRAIAPTRAQFRPLKHGVGRGAFSSGMGVRVSIRDVLRRASAEGDSHPGL